jgi:hypothetical protein
VPVRNLVDATIAVAIEVNAERHGDIDTTNANVG